MLAEYDTDTLASPRFTYIYAGDQRIAMYDQDGMLHFYLNDHLGSARVVLDSTGTVRDKYKRYYAFGQPASQTVATDQKYTYTGKPYDDDGAFDMYYYGARYYDGENGRFPAIDPARGRYASWSPYVYTLDNPLKFIDPDGAWSVYYNYIHTISQYAADGYGPPLITGLAEVKDGWPGSLDGWPGSLDPGIGD